MKAATGWGAMLYLERDGDVPFLAPLVPELHGFEIVSAAPGKYGQDYDVWRRGRMVRANQTLDEIIDWMRPFARDDDELKASLAKWAEAVCNYYGLNRRVR